MLSDEQLDLIESELATYFQKLEQEVIKDIARRVGGAQRFTETAELQAESLQKLGYSPWKIKAEVFKKLKANKDYKEHVLQNTVDYKKTIEAKIKETVEAAKASGDELVASAGDMAFRNDVKFWNRKGKVLRKNGELDKTVKFYQKQLRKHIGNLTGSLAFKGLNNAKIEKAYTEALNLGIIKVCSGAFTAETVTEEITKELAEDGVYYVNYKSGARRSLDTAIRLAIRTTSSQMAADIMIGNAEEMGEDLVEVSHHAGARNNGFGPENHASWQGKVYSLSGKPHKRLAKKLGYPIRKLSEATGYPDNPAGLCGYNCRHTFYPFFEGISEPLEPEKEPDPIFWEGKKLDAYAARQKQRALEREIRDLKRQIECGVKDLNGRLRIAELRYNNFIKVSGLKPHRGRVRVYSAPKPRHKTPKAGPKNPKIGPKQPKTIKTTPTPSKTVSIPSKTPKTGPKSPKIGPKLSGNRLKLPENRLKRLRTTPIPPKNPKIGPKQPKTTNTTPTPSKTAQERPKTLRNYEQHKEEWLDANVPESFKEVEAQIAKDMEELFENSNFNMRFNSEDIDALIDSGRFKNQFETKTSGGTLSAEHRRTASKKLFGAETKGVPGKALEKYGYLGYKDIDLDYLSGDGLGQYGDVVVTFDKKKVADRVTYTVCDSLGPAVKNQTIAGDVMHPGFAGIKQENVIDLYSNDITQDVFKKSINEINEAFDSRYIELQYHGDLTLDDVEQMAFKTKPSNEVIEQLKKHDIKVLYKDERGVWNEG